MSTMGIQRRCDMPDDLGIVGVGAIAEAIITGLCGEDTLTSIHLSPRSGPRARRLAARYPSVQVADTNQTVVERADIVLLCLRRRTRLPRYRRWSSAHGRPSSASWPASRSMLF